MPYIKFHIPFPALILDAPLHNIKSHVNLSSKNVYETILKQTYHPLQKISGEIKIRYQVQPF